MKILIFTILGCLMGLIGLAQSTISGKVSDDHGAPVPYATVLIKGSNSGTVTDTLGKYILKTNRTGMLSIKVSTMGYDSVAKVITIAQGQHYTVDFVLKTSSATLGEVVISAGSIEANNDRKLVVLRPMDIYTTAGSSGDIVGAIETLPGVQRVGDQTGLFVRGGDASESATIVDGMVMQNGFSSNVPGVAQRSRFSAYQFKGISFSSGGYSARFGDALSGVLELNTNDLPEQSTVSLNLNQGGIAASGAKLFGNSSLEATLGYTNLTPFYGLVKTNLNFFKPPVGFSGSVRYVWTDPKSHDLLKIMVNGSHIESGTDVLNPLQPDTTLAYDLKNTYAISQVYYKHFIDSKTFTTIDASYSNNKDVVDWGGLPYDKRDFRLQSRVELQRKFSEDVSAFVGGEFQHYGVNQTYDTVKEKYTETQVALYTEGEWKLAHWFSIKPGVRYEYSALLQKSDVAPRVAAAMRLGLLGQVSLAGGMFYQDAEDKYLLAGDRPNFQKAVHYIANYQYSNEDRTFRIEGYYKSYQQLVRELSGTYNPDPYRLVTSPVDNSGSGYAKGIDVFWRDKASIKNLDYWVSYSYIDTRRLYENFPVSATPSFISNNNLNVVAKYAFGSSGFNLSGTYSFASGRRYYDPNAAVFLSEKAPAYDDLALTLNYIFTVNKLFGVIYISSDNITNHRNVLGYYYNASGDRRYPVLPALNRTFFAGVMFSLSAFKKEDL